jgi:hypothetical protein
MDLLTSSNLITLSPQTPHHLTLTTPTVLSTQSQGDKMENIPMPQNEITIESLYRQKGEVMTQLEICQSKLQLINQQLQAYFNQQQINQAK